MGSWWKPNFMASQLIQVELFIDLRSRSVRYRTQSYLNFPSCLVTTKLFPSFPFLVLFNSSDLKKSILGLIYRSNRFVPKDESLAIDLDNFDHLIPCIVNKIQFQAKLFSCNIHESCNLWIWDRYILIFFLECKWIRKVTSIFYPQGVGGWFFWHRGSGSPTSRWESKKTAITQKQRSSL